MRRRRITNCWALIRHLALKQKISDADLKPGLVLDPQDKADGIGREVVYGFVLDTTK